MKGRNNYLCRKKLYDLTDQPVLSGLEEIEHYRAIAAWEKTTQTGDRAELAELPEASALWPKLDARADTCLGQKCKEYDRCFITEMRRRAAESDIIIVNHHLFFADLAIKLEADDAPDAGVLPECGRGDLRRSARTRRRSRQLLRNLGQQPAHGRAGARRRDIFSSAKSSTRRKCRERFNRCASARNLFFSLLPAQEGRFAFDSRREFLEENGEEFLALNQSLNRLDRRVRAAPAKARRSFHARPPRPAIAGAAQLRDGKRRPKHSLLDRAPRISWRSDCFARNGGCFERARLQPRRKCQHDERGFSP